jgi:ATP-binding cassette subfamily C protein
LARAGNIICANRSALSNSLATGTRGAESYPYGATVIALTIQAAVYLIVALLVSWQATLIAPAAGVVSSSS